MNLTEQFTLPASTFLHKTSRKETQLNETVSNAFYEETDQHVKYWRNLRFCLFKFYLDKVENKAAFRIFNTSGKWVASLIIEKERLLYAEKNQFLNGKNAISKFRLKLYKYGFILADSMNDHVRFFVDKIIQHFTDLTLRHFKYKSLTNIYLKFWDSETDLSFCSRSPVYRKLRKCCGLRQATKVMFGKNTQKYRYFVLTDLTSFTKLETCYNLIHHFKLTPDEVIKAMKETNVMLSGRNTYQFIKKAKKTYDLKRLQKYLINSSSITNLRDCLQMRNKLSEAVVDYISAQKLPINTEHDLLVHLTKDLTYLPNYVLPFYEELNKLPKRAEYSYEFPQTSNELRKWGQELNICIGSYDYHLIVGYNYCFSIVLAGNNQRYCVEVKQTSKNINGVGQVKGYRNHNLQTINESLYTQLCEDLAKIPKLKLKHHEYVLVDNGFDKDPDVDLIQKAHDWIKAK